MDTREFFVERRANPALSEEVIEDIAERAADKAIKKMEDKVFQQVGRTFINKFFKFVGVVILGAAYFLINKGIIKLPTL